MKKISKKSIIFAISCKLMFAVLFSLIALSCAGEKTMDEERISIDEFETPIDGEGLSVKIVNQIIEDFSKYLLVAGSS